MEQWVLPTEIKIITTQTLTGIRKPNRTHSFLKFHMASETTQSTLFPGKSAHTIMAANKPNYNFGQLDNYTFLLATEPQPISFILLLTNQKDMDPSSWSWTLSWFQAKFLLHKAGTGPHSISSSPFYGKWQMGHSCILSWHWAISLFSAKTKLLFIIGQNLYGNGPLPLDNWFCFQQ